jgi:hypothetical protein
MRSAAADGPSEGWPPSQGATRVIRAAFAFAKPAFPSVEEVGNRTNNHWERTRRQRAQQRRVHRLSKKTASNRGRLPHRARRAPGSEHQRAHRDRFSHMCDRHVSPVVRVSTMATGITRCCRPWPSRRPPSLRFRPVRHGMMGSASALVMTGDAARDRDDQNGAGVCPGARFRCRAATGCIDHSLSVEAAQPAAVARPTRHRVPREPRPPSGSPARAAPPQLYPYSRLLQRMRTVMSFYLSACASSATTFACRSYVLRAYRLTAPRCANTALKRCSAESRSRVLVIPLPVEPGPQHYRNGSMTIGSGRQGRLETAATVSSGRRPVPPCGGCSCGGCGRWAGTIRTAPENQLR